MENKPNFYAIIPANVRYDKDLPANAKLIYGEITALSNAEGYCWATNSYFADLYECHEKSVSRLISQLEQKGFIRIEIKKDRYKTVRNIYIIDSNKIVPVDSNVTVDSNKNVTSESNEIVTSELDKSVTQNITSINTTKNTTNNKKPLLVSAEIEQEFEFLWKLYPRKMGKKKAFDSYIKARKGNKTTYETIKNGLYRYIDYLKASGTDEQFIQHGSTWFNQQKWLDEYTVVGLNRKPKSPLEAYHMAFGGEEIEYPRDRKVINDYPDDLPQLF